MEKRTNICTRKSQTVISKPKGQTMTFYQNFTFTTIPSKPINYIRHTDKSIKIDKNIWNNVRKEDLQNLVERLEDTPTAIYNTIKRRRIGIKFRMLHQNQQVKQKQLLEKIKEKQKAYEDLLQKIIMKNQKLYLQTSLPSIKYISQNQLTNKINKYAQTMKFR